MSDRPSLLWVLSFAALFVVTGLVANGQESAEATDSIQFEPPLEASVRKTNGTLVQGRLVGIDAEGITFQTQVGKTFTYPNNTVRTVRTSDGKFQYAPGKDDVAETVTKARLLQPVPLKQQAVSGAGVNNSQGGRARVPGSATTPDASPSTMRSGTNLPSNNSLTQAAATGTGTGTPTNSGIQITWEFKCAKCGHKIESNDQSVTQIAACPKCGSSRNAAPAQPAAVLQPTGDSRQPQVASTTVTPSNVTPQPPSEAYGVGAQLGRNTATVVKVLFALVAIIAIIKFVRS